MYELTKEYLRVVKLTGPGLAKQAGGSLAGQLTFSNWRGKPYLKKLTRPKQPKTPSQVAMRAMMRFLSTQWASLPAGDKDTWNTLAAASQISPFNAFTGENITRWSNHLPPTKAYPATQTGTQGMIVGGTATGQVRHVDLMMAIIAAAYDNWTGLVFHSTVAVPDPDVDALVHVEQLDDLLEHTWIHRSLAPGTHYYRITLATDDGFTDWSVLWTGSAVVT